MVPGGHLSLQLFLPFPDVSHSFQKLALLLNVTGRSLHLSIQPSIFPCVKLKTVVNDLCPYAFLTFHEPPTWVWGRGYLPSKVGNKSKGLRDRCTVGRWHSLPPCAPHFILEAFGPNQEPKRTLLSFAFSAASLFPSFKNNIPQKKSGVTSCPFVQFLGQRCCLLHSTAWFHHLYTWALFDGKCFIFTNMHSRMAGLWPTACLQHVA